jgi:hypothetical protein
MVVRRNWLEAGVFLFDALLCYSRCQHPEKGQEFKFVFDFKFLQSLISTIQSHVSGISLLHCLP